MSLSGQLKRPFNGQLLHCPECLEHTDTSLSDQTTLQVCLESFGWAAGRLGGSAPSSVITDITCPLSRREAVLEVSFIVST